MLEESHSSRNSSGRNEERHGAKAGNRQPGSDKEAIGDRRWDDGMMVVVVVGVMRQKKRSTTLWTVPKAVALGVWTETARSTLNAGLPMHPAGMYSRRT